ncbi:MAG TPA: Imm42 family immunity protein [Candidatus Competibacter sp.]|nr:Imm42 family immunity protein [Candidatus Competibacter sp.]
MLIGDKQSFAVEYEFDDNSGGEWMYGKICYWIGGYQVGNYELGTSLRDVLFQMKYLVYDSGNRECMTLCATPPDEVFNLLKKSIYGESENNYNDILDTPARFDINIHVDVFDQWKVFLIDCDNYSMILFNMINQKTAHMVYANKGDFDSVIMDLYNLLNTEYDAVIARRAD